MLFLAYTLRRMRRHLGINIAMLLTLSIGAGLLGSLPAFAAQTAEQSLHAELINAHPSIRNIKIEAPGFALNAALNGYINDSLDGLVKERVVVNHIKRDIHPSEPVIKEPPEIPTDLENIWVWSFDKLNQHSSLTSGEWPFVTYPQTQMEALRPPTIQSVVTERVAKSLGIRIGDILQDRQEYKFLVTGIIEVDNPAHDVWWQDSSSTSLTIEPGLNEDVVIVPVFIHPLSMKEYFSDYAVEWRYILQTDNINHDNAENIEIELINLKNRLTANKARMTSGLPNLVQEFRQNLLSSRMVLYLLSFQAFLFVVFTLIMMANLLVTNSKNEIAMLTSRGSSRFQITLSYSVQMLVLTLIAGFLIGPLFSWFGLFSWGWITGEQITVDINQDTWYLSLIAASIGWLAVVITLIPATHAEVIDWQKSISRPSRMISWQRLSIDVFILAFGAVLFWQLSSSGSFVMSRVQGSQYADPLLLIGPSILMLALAMLYLRLFPVILLGLRRLTRSGRGIVPHLGLTRLARNPQRIGWVVLLISLASALILFAAIYSESLAATQQQIAEYISGTNLRLDGNKIPDTHYAEIQSVLPTSPVHRIRVQEKTGRGIMLLALEPDSFISVSEYPQGMTNIEIDNIMQAINQPLISPEQEDSVFSGNPYVDQTSNSQAIPAVFSFSAVPKGGAIGDHREFLLAGQLITLEIRGMIVDFPTVTSDFVLVDVRNLESVAGSRVIALLENRDYWIKTGEPYHEQLNSFEFIRNATISDSNAVLNIIRNNIMTLGTVRAFGINGFILAVISLAGIFLANFFSFRRREYEFGILRAYGLSHKQSNVILISEGFLVLIMGLISGIILGYSLTIFMRPYISLAVSRTLPGMTVHQIDVNWISVSLIVGILIAMYCVAMVLIIIALLKSNVHQVLRAGDE